MSQAANVANTTQQHRTIHEKYCSVPVYLTPTAMLLEDKGDRVNKSDIYIDYNRST